MNNEPKMQRGVPHPKVVWSIAGVPKALDQKVNERATEACMSKNAYVRMTVSRAVKESEI